LASCSRAGCALGESIDQLFAEWRGADRREQPGILGHLLTEPARALIAAGGWSA
jgi:hypothetical protein